MIILLGIAVNVCVADECYYNDMPFYSNKMEMVCSFDNISSGYSCISEVIKEGNMIQVNPPREKMMMVGVIDTFESVGSDEGLVRVYFRKQNIYLGDEFEFRIVCSDESNDFLFAVNVTPTYKDLYSVVYTGEKVKNNIGYYIASLFALFFAGGIIWFLWARWHGR